MKKHLFALLFFAPIFIHAQFMDFWTGKLNFGMEVTIQLNVTYEGFNPKYVSMDIPEQSVWELPCKLVKWTKDSFNVDVPSAQANIVGRKSNHDSVLVASWVQGVFNLPINFTRSYENLEPIRPQNPSDFPDYLVEQLEINNKKDNVFLSATLTIPKGYAMKGCAVLVSGSGAQDKDESIMGHKPFWIIADFLTKNGFAVIRFDDRGSYKSSGSFSTSTIFDFANDVNAAIDMAKERTGLDDSRMGLIGHSEGSMVSQIVLKDRPLGFFISLAGPACPVQQLMVKQNRDLNSMFGIKDKEFDKTLKPFLTKVLKIAGDLSIDSSIAVQNIIRLYKKSEKKFSDAAKTRFNLGSPEAAAGWLSRPLRVFLSYVPATNLATIKTPFLALNGTVDKQVSYKENLEVFEKYLGNNPKNEVKELENKNHLFQTTTKGDISEYGKLEETFSPDALVVIKDWLTKVYPH